MGVLDLSIQQTHGIHGSDQTLPVPGRHRPARPVPRLDSYGRCDHLRLGPNLMKQGWLVLPDPGRHRHVRPVPGLDSYGCCSHPRLDPMREGWLLHGRNYLFNAPVTTCTNSYLM